MVSSHRTRNVGTAEHAGRSSGSGAKAKVAHPARNRHLGLVELNCNLVECSLNLREHN